MFNSSPIPLSKNLDNCNMGNEMPTDNSKIPYTFERKNQSSRNDKIKNSEEDNEIPRIINTFTNNKNKNKNKIIIKSNEKLYKTNNDNIFINSLKSNNSLFNNEPQSESIVIKDNYNVYTPKANSGKMTLSELNNKNSSNINSYKKSDRLYNINNNNVQNVNMEDENNNYYYNDDSNKMEQNKENEEINLEDFLNENNNKNIISQKENEYILFDMNKTISEDEKNKISNNNDNNVNEVLNNDKDKDKDNDNHKRTFFSKILDIEILIDTSEIYTKPWSQLINNIYNKCESNDDSIQLISLGSQHTLCLSNKGKLYSFGWNKYCQCGKKPKSKKNNDNNSSEKYKLEKIEDVNEIKIDKIIKINDISCGEDHSLLIADKSKLYGFGLNNNGQLCYEPHKHKVISKPSLIKSFKKSIITNVQCTDNISFILNNSGETFISPWEDKHNQMHYIPIKLFFPLKPKIVSISCGYNFTTFLSEKGNVYSMGSNNKYGQLGLGDTSIQLSPKIISFFKNNKIKISQISCGYCHVLALSEEGSAYSWGYGGEGQLGLGEEMSTNYLPQLIQYFDENNIFVFQVSSGYHSSYFLTESNTVYICGTNGRDCIKDYIPKLIDIKSKYKDLVKEPCWICRILNCWNRSMSIFYSIFLDCHFINKDDEKVNHVLNLISKKWVNQSFSSTIMKGIDSINYI